MEAHEPQPPQSTSIQNQVLAAWLAETLSGHSLLYAEVSRDLYEQLRTEGVPLWHERAAQCLDLQGIPIFPNSRLAPGAMAMRQEPADLFPSRWIHVDLVGAS